MYKKCKVLMFEQADQIKNPNIGDIMKNTQYGLFLWTTLHNQNGSRVGSQEYKHFSMKQQHLYLICDDEIKDENYIIINGTNGYSFPTQYCKLFPKDKFPKGPGIVKLLKVIASTDKSLGLPSIPKSFLEEYVNKQGKIEEVNVEMELKYDDHDLEYPSIPILKLIDNNVIIQSIPKEVFTLEDMRKAWDNGYSAGLCYDMYDFAGINVNFEKFINSL
jgi:hypothetical protein